MLLPENARSPEESIHRWQMARHRGSNHGGQHCLGELECQWKRKKMPYSRRQLRRLLGVVPLFYRVDTTQRSQCRTEGGIPCTNGLPTGCFQAISTERSSEYGVANWPHALLLPQQPHGPRCQPWLHWYQVWWRKAITRRQEDLWWLDSELSWVKGDLSGVGVDIEYCKFNHSSNFLIPRAVPEEVYAKWVDCCLILV